MPHFTDAYALWQHRVADKMRLSNHPFLRDLIAEAVGTLVFVAFGTGVAAQAQLTEGTIGRVMEVSAGYATAWALGLFVAGPRTPGMCNPCIAFANALIGRLDFLRMLAFWLAELIGAILGSLVVLAVYWEKVWDYTQLHDGNVLSMNSTGVIFTSTANASTGTLCANQVVTGMFAIMSVMAILDANNWNFPYFYVILYATVAQYLQFNDFSIQTTSSNNPAYDFGGRIALSITGWGTSPFTYKDHSFWIFLVMPFVGTICGVLLYELVIGIHLPGAGKDGETSDEVDIDEPDD